MAENIVQKILAAHLRGGHLTPGSIIRVAIDQVLTQDATGTMAFLQFEATGVERIKVPLAVSYVDHNILQTDFRNADDHRYLQSVAAKLGAYFSRPGNGICHQLHLERFARPGGLMLGADSHTPTAGGLGMMAIGTGGLDVATVMAGGLYEIKMPKIMFVRLTGELTRPWVTAMDVIMEILRQLTVKGGVGKILEYGGPGISTLNVTERATITNMGAELGATTSIFPSDERTRHYLGAQGRKNDWVALAADEGASYDEVIEINLSELEPLVAKPHSPDSVVPIGELSGQKVDQVCIGSCTNSSYQVLKEVASILDGRSVSSHCDLTINPGSKQVYEMVAREGDVAKMIAAGARMLESACGPCIGMGQAPQTNGISVRSFNRNFPGRCGNRSASVYLCNPLTAAVIALYGKIVDPRTTDSIVAEVEEPSHFLINDNMILPPSSSPETVEIIRGPNIQDVPVKQPLANRLACEVLLKVGDNISTDDIMPAGSNILPLRSNIPAISEFVFYGIDASFPQRAKKAGHGIIVGGENYGQGSSREHAALAPMYLGIEAVLAKSLARIHKANLINYGILPLEFEVPASYEEIRQGHRVEIDDVRTRLIPGEAHFDLVVQPAGKRIRAKATLSEREVKILKAGGLLAYVKMSE
jgi:aconitate hydratase